MNDNQQPNLWNEGMRIVSRCPLCDSRSNAMEARLLGENGDTHLLHIRCRKCANSILALVLISTSGASTVGMVTDLSFDDVMRLRRGRRLTIDDVLAAHVSMRDDWLKAFRLPAPSGTIKRPVRRSSNDQRRNPA